MNVEEAGKFRKELEKYMEEQAANLGFDTLLNYIQLYLLSAVAIYKSLKVDLDENESYIVLYLHKNQMYEQGEDEETFLKNFKVWYRNQTGDELSDIRLNRAVDNLLKIKTIVIEDGKVRLQESVWHNKLG